MKAKNILCNSIALALVTTSALAADVEIRITGATAFRAAAMNAIKAKFDIGANYSYAHNLSAGSFNGADRCTFKGSFPGVSGTTTIRCSWNGSVEGIRAVAVGGTAFNPQFIQDSALTVVGENPLKTGDTAQQVAKFSFSDVRQSSTPISTPTLSPSNARVGVVVFSMIANEGAPAAWTNVTTQQFKALFQTGSILLSQFTGNAADTNPVYATGRNDGSGTRTTYMAETGLGITGLVNQFVTTVSTSTNINTIRKVPGFGTPGYVAANASTVWSQDVDGNGGYASGSSLRTDMGKVSTGVTVFDADGVTDLIGAPANIHLMTFLSNPDARTAATNGAKILTYNGVGCTSLQTSGTLSAADLAGVTEGQYSAWSFQQLYYNGTLSADETTVDTAIRTGIPTSLAPSYLNGVPISLMNVSRPDDGAPIAP